MGLTKITGDVLETGVVTYSHLHDRFKTYIDLGTGSAFSVDFSAGSVFKAVANAAATITLSNYSVNELVTVIVSGNFAITLAASGTPVFNKSGGVDYDGSANNILQILCTKDGANPEFFYAIGTYESDTTI